MKIVWDFHELVEFGERLNDYHEFETNIMTATQEIARVYHQALITRTPVLTGNLRKMWSAGDNLLFKVEKTDSGYQVTLENQAKNESGYKYGQVVNDGHYTRKGSWVQGRFFIENSIAHTEEQIERIISKELQKWLEWCVSGK
jgi:hypothetical protein